MIPTRFYITSTGRTKFVFHNGLLRRRTNDILSSFLYHHPYYQPCISFFSTKRGEGIFPNTTTTTTTTTTSSEAAGHVLNESFLKSKKVRMVSSSPRAIFPWRHSPYPLPRFIKDTDEYYQQGGSIGPSMPCFPQIIQQIMFLQAATMINIPWYQILLFGQSQEELTYAFRKAFERSIAGILAETYHVPFHQIRKEHVDETLLDDDDDDDESFPVDFQYICDPTQLEQTNDDNDIEDDDDDTIPGSQYMIESNLRSLYQSAREQGKGGKLRIRLSTEAVSAQIQSMFVVPFLTRDDIQRDPNLQQSFYNIYKSIHHQQQDDGRTLSSMDMFKTIITGLENLATRQMNVNSGIMESTVIAQVAIQCREVFSVTDMESNEIIQGDAKERTNDVTHLVRFEIVCRTTNNNNNGNQFEIGSWQITDWDDILGGNIWFI